MHLIPIQDLFHKNDHVIKGRTFSSQGLQIAAKFFPMLVQTPYFGEAFNQKIVLNHD